MSEKIQPQISVIVPVYNVQKYIRECIESILSQTFNEIEIILINDGSKDESGNICDMYAKKDTRIRVIHKQNEGVSKARKDGLRLANSEYIAFIDSDDFISPDYFENMYNEVKKYKLDLVECNYYTYKNEISIPAQSRKYEDRFFDNKDEFLNTVYKSAIIEGKEPSFLCNKMYKKGIITDNNIDFGIAPNEDYYFNMQYFLFVERYLFINKPGYYYRSTPNSLSRKNNDNTFELLLVVQNKKEEFMRELGLNDSESLLLSYKWFLKYTEDIVRMLWKFKSKYSFFQKLQRVKYLMSHETVVKFATQLHESELKNIFTFCIINKIYAICPLILFSNTLRRISGILHKS